MACYHNGGVIRALVRRGGHKGVAAVSVDVNFKLPPILPALKLCKSHRRAVKLVSRKKCRRLCRKSLPYGLTGFITVHVFN